jgi:hypothetical protein
MNLGRRIFSAIFLGVAATFLGLGVRVAFAEALSSPGRSSFQVPATERVRAQAAEATPTPRPTPTPTPESTPTSTTTPPEESPTPPEESEDAVNENEAQDPTDQVNDTVDSAENAAGEIQNEVNERSSQAAGQVDEATSEVGSAVGQAPEGASAQGWTDLQTGSWTEASNAYPSGRSDLVTVVAAGNDVLGEPPAESSESGSVRSDRPNPWWLPVSGSQWLLLAAVVALVLIAFGSVLVAMRRRRHGTAGWAR